MLHSSGAHWGGGADHPLELSPHDGGVEVGARPRHGLHHRPQTKRTHAPHCLVRGAPHQRGTRLRVGLIAEYTSVGKMREFFWINSLLTIFRSSNF